MLDLETKSSCFCLIKSGGRFGGGTGIYYGFVFEDVLAEAELSWDFSQLQYHLLL